MRTLRNIAKAAGIARIEGLGGGSGVLLRLALVHPAWCARVPAGAVGLAALLALPAVARAEDLVVLRDGRCARVEHAEVLPDRVRIETTGPAAAQLPPGVPFTTSGAHTVDVSRDEVRAVFPHPDLPRAARPHAERYGHIAQQLTDRVHQDLQRSWSLPLPPGR